MQNFIQGLIGIVLVSAMPSIGIFIATANREKLEKYTHLMISFAVGALLGNGIIHLIPEAFETAGNTQHASIAIVVGILVFYGVEQFFHWHHSRAETTEQHHSPLGMMNIIGDSVHNFLDGAVVASAFLISSHLGWITVLAVVLHEIPHEIADLSIYIYTKWTRRQIIMAYLTSGAAAILGYLISAFIGSFIAGFAPLSLAATAGGFIYIACSDLIPDLHHHGGESMKERLLQVFIIVIGIALFTVL